MKLRGKFIFAFLFCGLAPLLLNSVSNHYIAGRAMENIVKNGRTALEETTKAHLAGLIDAKEAQLDDYVDSLRSEALTFASVRMLSMALENMGPGFREYRKAQGYTDEDIARQRESLRAHYATEFKSKYLTENEGKEPPIDEYIDALTPETVAMQYRFFIEKDIPQPLESGPNMPPPGPGPRNDYSFGFSQLNTFLSQATDRLGYYDLLLVDGDSGVVIYSAAQGVDFGVNLKRGPLENTPLGACFRSIMQASSPETVVFTDFAPYFPAHGQASSFLGVPIYHEGKRLGAVIFRLNLAHLNRIMSVKAGLGETGAMMLIGPDHLLRSDVPGDTSGQWKVRSSFLRPENSRINFQTPDGEVLQKVLEQEESGVQVLDDFRSRARVLTAYSPFDILGQTWALVAMIRTEEAYAPIERMRQNAEDSRNAMGFTSDIVANAALFALYIFAEVFARRISRSLRNTVDILKDMAQGEGDRTRRLVVYGRDEVGELAQAFNDFMDKLEGVYLRLQREVSERKAAQVEIQKREAYFKALIENAPDVIMIINPDLTTAYVSPSYERTLGYTLDELRNRPPLDYIHPDDHDQLQAVLQQGIENPGQPVTMEFRFLHKNGEWRWVQAIGSSQLDDTAVNGIVINMRDITERKRTELIMREYNTTLEREVAERTMEIRSKTEDLALALDNLKSTQDQLILNEKMASLGALTAGIAHEIKNPLNFVNNFADLSTELVDELRQEVEKLRDTPEVADFEEIDVLLGDIQGNVKKILEHGRRADSIVRSMLLHSRGVSGQRGKTDLNKLLDEYVHLTYHGMRAQDNTFNIEFDLHYDDNIGSIELIPQDISRVFLNILNNACYATLQRTKQEPGYKPRLTVRTKDLGDLVEIRIRDNGTGIPESIRRDIFNPFFTTKPAGQGTGLGLSISYDIVVKEHQGEILCESEPGEYTEFIVRLPKVMAVPA